MTQNEIDFIEDEAQLENDDDVGYLDQSNFSTAVVSGNDWTAETIINQINKGNIQLNPDFQRRDAWDKKRKSRFIESLILGLPVPQVVLAESKERRGKYIVLDGKQRLLTIRQFAATEDDADYDQLKLTSLDIRNDLKGKTLDDLKDDLNLFEELSAFENQPIRTVVIKNWPSEDFLYHVFLRLNTGSVPLSPQELRQALHPGGFVKYLDKTSSESAALKEILNLKKPDFRMRDSELLLRYLSLNNYLGQYTGNLKKFLDETCSKLNSEWNKLSQEIESQVVEFELAHEAVKSIFNKNCYRKWTGGSYENRFNRAIYDIMTLSFSDKDVRQLAAGKEKLVENAFKELCSTNVDFKTSIETTTKSLGATHTRLSVWFKKLNDTIDCNLPVPKLINGRII
ncbi:MAG: DUF262 domain-containing protein [Oceanisphaera sp.]|uniref:DUF262 domain-containing protein n=1 Tax=Oceanisphaera sp. TaxID=1929979 RepID=UPI003C78AA41